MSNNKYRICSVESSQEKFRYRSPMKFGGRVVEDVTVYHVDVTIEDTTGKRTIGHGSMTMGNIWAWPSSVIPADRTLEVLVLLADEIVAAAGKLGEFHHPVPLSFEFEHQFAGIAQSIESRLELEESIPKLAQLVAASPFDGALHDAFGKHHSLNSFQTLTPEFLPEDLSCFLGKDFTGCYLSDYVSKEPHPELPLYHLIGALDPIIQGFGKTQSESEFPELLGDWIMRDGLTHMKIKLAGDDFDWDIERVLEIDSAARNVQNQRGCRSWCYSLDFNEKCKSIDYVIEFLNVLNQRNPEGLGRIQYIEQPTHRDLTRNTDNPVHDASKLKPVVIDESLVDLDSLLMAREQGYSGIALKACKGQTGSLLMAAAAQKLDMFLCVQDLTCVGHNFLHSASLAAHIPTVAAIEGNGRQYCPEGNRDWESEYPDLFFPNEGRISTERLNGVGLGF